MKNFYLSILTVFFLTPTIVSAQPCANLKATFKVYESRCAATGAIKINATDGSGSYKYRVTGTVSINFTTSDSITGLPAGNYKVEVVDINTGCQFVANSIKVGGSYADPRFSLNITDISCENQNNGQIEVAGLQFGREPFMFTIVAPSAMGIGTSSSDGVFTGLKAGNYTIQLTDSCGGIQTRSAVIANYTWSMETHSITRTNCNLASGVIKVKDNRNRYSYTGGGIPGMTYGILLSSGDTMWSSNPNVSFDATGVSSTKAFAKDACGLIKTVTVNLAISPSIGSTIKIDQNTCNTFRATVQSINQMYSASFQIFDNDNNLLSTNATGVFPGLAYGSYKIVATDACTGVTITRNFSASGPVVSVDANVKILERSCNAFSAMFTGQKNATNPTYKIYDVNGTIKGNNTTGKFQFLTYGTYRMEMKDGCVDTTIERWIDVQRAEPKIDSLSAAYVRCDVFGFQVKADSVYGVLTYCLYDDQHNQIACNNNGKFDDIPFGDYCVEIQDACTGISLTRCISVAKTVLSNDLTIKQNKFCSSVTLTVQTTNYKNGLFELYDNDNNLVASNNTGVFSTVSYGDYCVKATSVCGDNTVTNCFSATPVIPSGKGSLTASNQRCDIFDMEVTGISGLTSPVYTLKNSSGVVIYKGPKSKFEDIAYGNYCVEIENNCYDTTITICQLVKAPTRTAMLSFKKSCNYGFTKLSFESNVYPVTVMVINPSNVMVTSQVFNSKGDIDNIPGLPEGQVYTIQYQWTNCSGLTTVRMAPDVAYLDHSATVEQLCPGSVWPEGYGNILADAITNAGSLTVKIIKKNNDVVSLSPSQNNGSVYQFNNLGPATYVVSYTTSDACNTTYYDTVTITNYQYPNMDQTSAFQCDNTGFSVGAYVNNGVAPYTYEIISSTPSTPSIVSPPQSNPVFNIDNGIQYQLIRLRAVDACGNATLGDASILPLANNTIRGTTDNCIGSQVKLSIDTMINSMVTWTFKKNENDVDETVLGTGFSYQIDPFSFSDIGYYYCNIVMNNGCITRRYEFHLDGACHGVLPVISVDLKGKMQNDKSLLDWTFQSDEDVKSIYVERSNGGDFKQVGQVKVKDAGTDGKYNFTDEQPELDNQYRLKLVFEGGKVIYSKVIHLARKQSTIINVYPNPATDYVNVDFNTSGQNTWMVELVSVGGQKIFTQSNISGQRYTIKRTSSMPSGMYLLKVINQKTGDVDNHKVLFR